MKKTITTLCLFLFFTTPLWAASATGVQSQVLAKTGQSWNDAPLPAYPTGTPEISILRIQIPPGTKLPMHHHPVINAGVLLKGELTVITKTGKTLHLKAGEAIVEVVDTPHYGINEGNGVAEIIVFYAGEKEKAITIIE